MQSIDHTVNHVNTQPGYSGTGSICLSVHKRLTGMTVNVGVHCLSIANEQFESYASDLGMT